MATSFLDLVGILLVGLVGALSVTTVQSVPPPATVSEVAAVFGLESLSSQELVLVLAGAAAVVLLTKSILSSFLTRRVFVFLANRQALVSARLSRELMNRPLTFIQNRSSQETAFALINGVSAATIQILGQIVVIVTELALLAVLATALLFLSPGVAIGAIAFFALIAWLLQRFLGSWASRVGAAQASADIKSLSVIQEAIGAYREITVSDRRELYVERIQNLRWIAARVSADAQFIGMLPKYMLEAALVVGGFLLAGALFATQDSVVAVGTLALFLAAGTRVMPALLRLQGASLVLRGASGVAEATFRLAEDLGNPLANPTALPSPAVIREGIKRGSHGLVPSLVLTAVDVRYPNATRNALSGIDLTVEPGESVALVGPSGAGKSTLADVMLGIVQPSGGRVLLGGMPPSEALKRWPGAIAYVPQDVILSHSSIRENIALGLPMEAIDDDLVWQALERAHLVTFVRDLPDGLSTVVGERGAKLSGGQRQRLGIARSLYTQPRLLVLDEATSALDGDTEHAVTQTIHELGGDVTVVVIAHRLSTVREVEHLVYLDGGRILSEGTFAHMVDQVPAFARHAKLGGL